MSKEPIVPKAPGGKNRRKQVRVEADISVRFSDENGQFIEECVGNVSRGGVFIETLRPRPMKDIVELFMKLPGSQEEVTVQGEVVHVAPPKQPGVAGKDVGMGVRFIIVEPKQKLILKTYIDGLLGKAGGGTRETPRVYDQKSVRVKMRNVEDFKTKIMPNISRGGLFFETDQELTLFDIVDLVLMSPIGGDDIHLKSEVVHIRREKQGGKSVIKGVGVRFVQMGIDQVAAIDRFIKQILNIPED